MALINEVRTNWTGVAGSPYYTTIRHLEGGSVDLDGFVAAWGTFVNTMRPHFSDNLVASSDPEVRVIESTTGETVGVVSRGVGTWAGSGVGDELPPATQLLIRLGTGVFTGGRRIRGRIFFPGQIESDSASPGVPSAGYRGTTDTALTTMLNAMGPAFVVYSPTHRVYASVTSAVTWNQWASLRSRRD